jgi:hypothetical protein
MAFPVIATVKFCFTRIPREWDIIWRYLQVPFLLCCLFGCVMLGIYVLAGPETFISTEIKDGNESFDRTVWYWVYFFTTAYAPWVLLIPFLITWGRYTLVDERGLEGRLNWSWGHPEWSFFKGGIMFLLVVLGWGLVFGLVTGIPIVVGVFSVMAIRPEETTLTILKFVGGTCYVAAFGYFIFLMARLNVVFIPLSFGASFTSDSLWAVTKGKGLRYLGGILLIGLCTGLPTIALDLALTPILFGDGPTANLKAQLLQSIFLLPITAISFTAMTTFYSELWRYSGGHEEWSGGGTPPAAPPADTTPA